MLKPLVSIVLPVHNGEKYLKESVQSVLTQKYQNFELILVDDASSDSSKKTIESYVESDERIIGLFNERNLGLPASLNKGFLKAKGEFFTWTSDDNRFLPTFLEELVLELTQKDADFVFSDYYALNAEGDRGSRILMASPKLLPARNVVGASFLYTRKVYEKIGDYSLDLVLVEDYDYWLRIYEHFKMVYYKKALYEYRFHEGSLTKKRADQILLQKKALHEKFDHRLKMGFRIRGLLWIYNWYLDKKSFKLFLKALLGAVVSFDLALSELWKNRVKL